MKCKTIVKTISPVVKRLGFRYMIDKAGRTPVVFAKKDRADLYLLLLIGRLESSDGAFSIELSLSPTTNAGLRGRDVPDNYIRQVGKSFWKSEDLSDDSALTESIYAVEKEMLQDEIMIKDLKSSKKLMLETQLQKWVISWYHEKEESELPLLSFIKYKPKKTPECVDPKWFTVAEVVLRNTWMPMDKDRVYSFAIQSYWKHCLDSM